MNTPISLFFKPLKGRRNKNQGKFSTAGVAGSSSAPDTNSKASHRKSDNISHGLDANDAGRISSMEVVRGPGHSVTTSLSPQSKARSLLGARTTQSHNNIAPPVDCSNNRFQDPTAAFRNSPEKRPAVLRQSAVELSAEPITRLAEGDPRITEGNEESGSRIPPGELEVPNEDTALTYNQMPSAAALGFPVTEGHLDRDELHIGNMNRDEHSLTSYGHQGHYSTSFTWAHGRLEREVVRPTSSMSPVDPRAGQLRRLEKCNAEFAKENRALKGRCDVLEEQRKGNQITISRLKKGLNDISEDIERVKNDAQSKIMQRNQRITALEQNNTRYSQELRASQLALRQSQQVDLENQNRLREREEQLRVCYREIDILTQQKNELQHENESMNKQHEEKVSFLTNEHSRAIMHLKRENRSIFEKAQKDLEDVNNKHETERLHLNERHKTEVLRLNEERATEVLSLNEKHRRVTDDMTSKFEEEMKTQSHRMQSIIDDKNRTIAAQDIRMASYNKQIHGVIPDGELERKFRGLALSIDNLVNELPRPESYIVDTTLDRTSFLRRNSLRGSRVWAKFLRKVCWDILIRGFFQMQPGFGSFGYQGDGYLALLQLYKLFAKSNAQSSSDPKRDFPNNKIANSWRASLFGAILSEVTSTVNDSSVIGFSKFFRNNVRVVRNDLVETLQKVCQKDLDARCYKLVPKLCNDVGLLSLQLGAQQSVVVVETCGHEDWIQSGALFKDDNDFNENSLKVDIMVQPALKRIGDGGHDFTTQKVLVAGSIVALRAGDGNR